MIECKRRGRTAVLASLVGVALPAVVVAQQGPFALPDDHFLCYKAKTVAGDLALPSGLQVNLSDQLEADRDFHVTRGRGLCTPANKNGEGITDVVTHLTSYQIAPTADEPAHTREKGIRIFNQFGEFTVDTVREDRLLVPASVDASGGPVIEPDSDDHDVDHYKCYKVRRTKGTSLPRGLTASMEDQFESPAKLYRLSKPKFLCTPVDKNGEGIKNVDGHLACYRAKPASGQPKHVPRQGVSTADQLVVHQVNTRKEELLCVPSLKDPPAEFCGDGVVNQPPFEQCDGDPTSCAPGETCTRQCQCISSLGTRTLSFDPANSAFFSSFLGQVSIADPVGTLLLDGGALDGASTAPISLVGAPHYVTVDVNLGEPQTICFQFLSCSGTIHCAGGANVDALQELDSLSAAQPSCIQDGTNGCPNDPTSVCCSNSCEGFGVGSGNAPQLTLGVGVGESGAGALIMTCDVRQLPGLPIGSDCATQDYAGVPVLTHALTTGTATAEIPQHCAGPGAPADAVPSFSATGSNFDCGTWTVEDGPGAITWALPAEEPTDLLPGDASNALIFGD